MVFGVYRAEPEVRGHLMEIIPMRRIAEPEEMAEAVIWHCSDEASFVTATSCRWMAA
jgi:NAD(P)-dependent dehydrogenase (short-subunit alcohol dehydrogenase family)